jgi:Raf kinase inhibitor-like YbhB/YbcL family protein
MVIRARWRRERPDIADGQTHATISVSSSSFANGDQIPLKFTCNGSGLSPDIQLPSPPASTKSFLLVMDDPDAWGFVHWLLYNIPADTRDIPEGASPHKMLPAGAAEGQNSTGNAGYFGPCPPGSNPHHYLFRVYALDTDLTLPAGVTKKQLAEAARGHILAEGTMTAQYTGGSK